MRNILLFLLLATTALGQMKPGIDAKGVYQNGELGFSFTPPSGLTDVTVKVNTSGDKDPNTVQLLLFELSGPNSNDIDWRGLAIQSYPRSQVSASSDFEAEAKLSRTVVGRTATETAPPTKVTINSLTYALSHYQNNRGLLTQYSRVYATLIHGQMVAFVFTGNSNTNLDTMAEALKTVKMVAEKSSK